MRKRGCRITQQPRLISIDVFVDNVFGEGGPGWFFLDVVDEGGDAGGGHVVDDDVGLGGEAFEEVGEVVEICDFAAVVGSNGRPKEEMTTGVTETLQGFAHAVEEFAVGVDEGEVDVDEDVGVFHGCASTG